jgi:hypothetical protein
VAQSGSASSSAPGNPLVVVDDDAIRFAARSIIEGAV